jgi:hypothetical protein
VLKATQEAWKRLIARFRQYGMLSNDPMPTEAALVTMTSMIDKFNDSDSFPVALYWFLQASRFGRYSGRLLPRLRRTSGTSRKAAR